MYRPPRPRGAPDGQQPSRGDASAWSSPIRQVALGFEDPEAMNRAGQDSAAGIGTARRRGVPVTGLGGRMLPELYLNEEDLADDMSAEKCERGLMVQHDVGHHHMGFNSERMGFQEYNRWQQSEVGEKTRNFNGNIQKEQHALARDKKHEPQVHVEGRKRYEGGSSGFRRNPDMDQYTPPTDVRATRQRNLQTKCQERLFPGTKRMIRNKEASSILSNQLCTINQVTSGLANASHARLKCKDVAKLNATECPDATLLNEIQAASVMVHAGHEGKKQNDVIEGLHCTPSNKIPTVPACDNIDETPVSKIQNILASEKKLDVSDSEKTPLQKSTSYQDSTDATSSVSTTREKNCHPSLTDASDSEKTPFQKSSSYQDSTDATSSVSTSREKSRTPTLTDLENSVHYDCRVDKVLRVALDYAFPEELA